MLGFSYDFNQPMMPYHPRGSPRYNRANAQKFESDYDFEKANEEFLNGQRLKKLNLQADDEDNGKEKVMFHGKI